MEITTVMTEVVALERTVGWFWRDIAPLHLQNQSHSLNCLWLEMNFPAWVSYFRTAMCPRFMPFSSEATSSILPQKLRCALTWYWGMTLNKHNYFCFFHNLWLHVSKAFHHIPQKLRPWHKGGCCTGLGMPGQSRGEQDDRHSGGAKTSAAPWPEECPEKLEQQTINSEMQAINSKGRKEALRPSQLQVSVIARA